jgi:hypothetical protein
VLLEATVYMDGMGLIIGLSDASFITVIKEFIKIKMAN